MTLIPPPRNLHPEATRWGKWVETQMQRYEDRTARSTEAEMNANAAKTATIGALAQQIQYLASLTTLSASGAHINTGSTPGDQTFRWFESSPTLSLQTQCPTGRLLVTVGTGQCTVAPGEMSAVAAISFQASTPSGWSYALESVDSRLYSTSNISLGVPLVVNAPLSGIPTDQVVTITVKYGIWSSSTATLASADFQSNYVIAQVLPG